MVVAIGEAAYSDARVLLSSSLLKVCYIGWCFCFFYHLANGVRHLVWDLGIGFERVQYQVSGWLVILFTFAASACYALVVII